MDKIITPSTPVETVEVIEPKIETETHEVTEKPLDSGYITELWNMGEASGHFKMPEYIKQIDEYVFEVLERDGLDSRKSYEDVIQKYEKKLDLPDETDIYTKTQMLAELMMIDKKLYDAWKEKEEFLKKDPEEMSPAELRKFIKERI